jgi:hemin uptake protein HemP
MDKPFYDSINFLDLTIATEQSKAAVLRPRLRSSELFGIAREVVIEHAGEEYRLRLTRQGKLILTK